MSRHAPGRWRAAAHEPGDKLDYIIAGDKIIATVDVDDPPFPLNVVIANKKMLAAGPELLDALLHARSCGACSNDSWSACPSGARAEALIARLVK